MDLPQAEIKKQYKHSFKGLEVCGCVDHDETVDANRGEVDPGSGRGYSIEPPPTGKF